jgi:adenylate cyclase
MEPKGFRRKLTAILSADVAGYSRLMQDNEATTVKTLESYKQIISDLITQHRGRVVDSPGDNLLAEFASVVDAVQCAVASQKELQACNIELPENRRMRFRMGINLGDVIEEESRIYGDEVNIAARLESLADPGGICISKTALDHIKTKLPYGYAFLGEQTVKNIAHPIKAYKILMKPRILKESEAERRAKDSRRRMGVIGLVAALVVLSAVILWQFFSRPAAPPVATIERAEPKRMAFPLPESPSIAVLQFLNLSEDSKQERLCAAITDNIINGLSKFPQLFVIASGATAPYKGKTGVVKQVSEDLGVRYVVEGSVQRSADRIRITTKLTDAITGNQLWTEIYDANSEELFDLQDDITLKVLQAVEVKIASGTAMQPKQWEIFSTKRGFDCYLKSLETIGHIQRATIPETDLARQKAEEGIALCPELPHFYYYLAVVHLHHHLLGSPKSYSGSIDKAIELFHKAIAMDESNAGYHANLGWAYSVKKDHDKAIAEGQQAVALNPGSAFVLFRYAEVLTYVGKPEEAIPLFEKSARLNPLSPPGLYNAYGVALRDVGRLEEAVALHNRALERSPNLFSTHANLAAAYIMIGRENEARVEAAEVMRLNPKFSLEWFASVSRYKDTSALDKAINAMRKAGLPDKPPAAQP